jgi:hypothetical protein
VIVAKTRDAGQIFETDHCGCGTHGKKSGLCVKCLQIIV